MMLNYPIPKPGERIELKMDWRSAKEGARVYHIKGTVEQVIPHYDMLPDADLIRFYPKVVEERGIEWARKYLKQREHARLVVRVTSHLSKKGEPCFERPSENESFLVMPGAGMWGTSNPQRLQIYRIEAPAPSVLIFDSERRG